MRLIMRHPGRRLTVLVLPLLAATSLAAQTDGPPELPLHVLHAEAGGLPAFEGGYGTANYERRVLGRTYGRAGLFVGSVNAQRKVVIPLMLNALFGARRSFLEVGGGLWLAADDDVSTRLAATVGYRWQAAVRGPLFRLGLAFDLGPTGWTLYPWPAASLGWVFP